MLLERHVGERPAKHDAGIVDQYVDRPGLLTNLVAQGDDARRVGDVHGTRVHRDAQHLDRRLGLGQYLFVQVGEDDCRAALGELDRHLEADPLPASRDQDPLAAEIFHGVTLPASSTDRFETILGH